MDTKKEKIGVAEANRLAIPIVGVVDSNCDPDLIQYPIPGNDDAIRALRLFGRMVSDAVLEGGRVSRDKESGQSAPGETVSYGGGEQLATAEAGAPPASA